MTGDDCHRAALASLRERRLLELRDQLAAGTVHFLSILPPRLLEDVLNPWPFNPGYFAEAAPVQLDDAPVLWPATWPAEDQRGA